MEFDHKKAGYRKSRAPWQGTSNNAKISNPYANANTSINTVKEANNAGQGQDPYGSKAKLSSRKHNRRMSIHASAAAAGTRRPVIDAASLGPVPPMYQHANNSAGKVVETGHGGHGMGTDIESKIFNELANGSATEVDDYYKVLVQQKALVVKDIKTNIDQNQKNILELTKNLKETQDELLQLRLSTKDLYEILNDFKKSAQRRLDLEQEESQAKNTATQNLYNKLSLAKGHQKRKDRSSVIVLEKMWVSELQSLCKHVEGASKYVQPLPGRHVLAESGRWFEMNVGTWKPTKAIHLFLLNDMILIATKKIGGQEGGKKARLQAIHCWPIHDVHLADVSTPNSSGAPSKEDGKVYLINIKTRSLSYVYQTDRYDHFLKVTEAYNKAKNEMIQKDRVMEAKNIGNNSEALETDEQKKQLRDSLRNSGIIESATDDMNKRRSGSQRHSNEVVLQDISARVHSRHRSHDYSTNGKPASFINDKKGQFFNELRKVEERLDEVDVEIAHNRYTESVGLIRYIENKISGVELAIGNNKANSTTPTDELRLLIDVIKLKLNSRKSKIQQCLAFELQHNIDSLSKQDISTIIEFFHSFDQLNKGISLFLLSISDQLSRKVSRLVIGVQGSTKIDIVNYLSNLVIINVSIIKRAISIYDQCIVPVLKKNQEGNVNSSGLINWAIEEITKLVFDIKKHLFGTLVAVTSSAENDSVPKYQIKDENLYFELKDVIRSQLSELKAVGVNVEYLFDDILLLQ